MGKDVGYAGTEKKETNKHLKNREVPFGQDLEDT